MNYEIKKQGVNGKLESVTEMLEVIPQSGTIVVYHQIYEIINVF